MRTLFVIGFAASVLMPAGPVLAAPYGVLSIDARAVSVIDLGSIRKTGALVQYDIASSSHYPLVAPMPGLIETRHRKETDCQEKRTRLLEMKVAMDGAEPKAPPWAEMPGEWTEVDPLEFPIVCLGVLPIDRFRSLDEARTNMLKLSEPDDGRRR